VVVRDAGGLLVGDLQGALMLRWSGLLCDVGRERTASRFHSIVLFGICSCYNRWPMGWGMRAQGLYLNEREWLHWSLSKVFVLPMARYTIWFGPHCLARGSLLCTGIPLDSQVSHHRSDKRNRIGSNANIISQGAHVKSLKMRHVRFEVSLGTGIGLPGDPGLRLSISGHT